MLFVDQNFFIKIGHTNVCPRLMLIIQLLPFIANTSVETSFMAGGGYACTP